MTDDDRQMFLMTGEDAIKNVRETAKTFEHYVEGLRLVRAAIDAEIENPEPFDTGTSPDIEHDIVSDGLEDEKDRARLDDPGEGA